MSQFYVGVSDSNIPPDVLTDINVQTGISPVVPSGNTITFNGAVVAAGTNPVRTDGTGASTMALEVQISQAIAATDATKIGLASFNSANFTVDANGFVSSSGTTPTSFITDDGTANPSAGILNVKGGSGIQTYVDPNLSNNLFIKVQNSTTDVGQTVNVQTIDLSTIDCSVAGTYFFTTQISAYSTDGIQALGGVLYTTVMSNGVTATVVDDTDAIAHETAGLSGMGATTNYEIVASGSNALLQVTGQNTFTLNWAAITIYVFRGL